MIIKPRQVVPAETLIDAIWSGVEDRVARRRLHTAVWKLRLLLGSRGRSDGSQLIKWTDPGYLVDLGDEQLDWIRFRRLRVAGERALREGAPGLASTYLSAALSLWVGTEALVDVGVPADDLGLVAELNAGRERALGCLVEAWLQLGDYDRAIPELERRVALDPLDDETVARLIVAHHRAGNSGRALAVCSRYLERCTEDVSARPSQRIVDLQTAILRRDPQIDGDLRQAAGGLRANERSSGHGAFLSAAWPSFVPSPTDPLPAELHLLIEEHGGRITEASDLSVDASFADARAAMHAAIALQRPRGHPTHSRVGVEIASKVTEEAFEGPSRARARLLAVAARGAQILASGPELEGVPRGALPPRASLKSLGSHRLNALTEAAPVFQVTAPGMTTDRTTPRWFDEGHVHNLSRDRYRFVGRDQEIDEITERLAQARLVTLSGAPGCGKTRLAAHVAAGLADAHRDGVWFVGLHSLSQPGLVATTMADVLHLPRSALHLDALLRFLRDKYVLVILDNCEHLLTECRILMDRLLPACPWVTVLATSREALGSSLELVVPISPFEPPPLHPPKAVLNNAAVQLFLDRLSSEEAPGDPEGALPREVEAAARVCRAVEGIPLALVLAAARARELGTTALADLLEGGLGEGKGLTILSGADGAKVVQDTLFETMEWSYRLLGERERELFDRLSVFRTGFIVEDAVEVCAGPNLPRKEIPAALGGLLRASLVHAEEGEAGPFRLLQPVRDFASVKLAARSKRAASVRRRHARHFLALAQAAEPHLRGPQDRETLDRLDASLPDLYAAVEWAVDERAAGVALRLVGSLWVYWLVRGRIAEGLRMVESALTLDPTPTTGRAKALMACAALAWVSGDLERTRETSREVLAVAEATGDAWSWAWGALGTAAAEMFNGEDETVPIRIEEILPIFRDLGNDWDTSQAVETLGGAAWYRGQIYRAETALSEAVALYRSLRRPHSDGITSTHGLVLALLGHIEEGAGEVDESIAVAYEAGDLVDLSYALCHRAAVARYGGNNDLARPYYRDALRMAREAGQVWLIQWALDGLGGAAEPGTSDAPARLEASVQLLACAEVLAKGTGVSLPPREREYHNSDLERMRALLGEPAFEAAFAQGASMSMDEAIELALSLDEPMAGAPV